jgi:mRNA interferase RelE/StbE
MKIFFTRQAQRSYQKLPLIIQKKADKQLSLLLSNYRHPSLKTRKMSGVNKFEARIDIHYRLTFIIKKEGIIILTIGPHNKGLGKH